MPDCDVHMFSITTYDDLNISKSLKPLLNATTKLRPRKPNIK